MRVANGATEGPRAVRRRRPGNAVASLLGVRLLVGVLLVAGVIGPQARVRAEDGAARPGDPGAGERVFVKCRACHQIGERAGNAVGPVLNGVIGRHSGSIAGYNYSDANKNSGLTWDEATFREYIRDPKAKVPGTKMTFAGLGREKDVEDVLAYLKQFGPDGKKR